MPVKKSTDISGHRLPIPEPFEFAVCLSLLVIVLATWFTPMSFMDNVTAWGDGLWGLVGFMTQMCLILLGGFVVASSKPVMRGLKTIVAIPKAPLTVYLLTFLVSAVACWLNWGLGLVVGAFFALEAGRVHSQVHFPLLVAISYMGFLFWHGGLSGSIPLTVATPGNFSYQDVGGILETSKTIFSPLNITLLLSLFIALSLYIFIIHSSRQRKNQPNLAVTDQQSFVTVTESSVETSSKKVFYWSLILIIGLYLGHSSLSGHFRLGLDQVNLCLIFIGLILHGRLNAYMSTVKMGCVKLAPILVQYPLYAGIMSVIKKSGLGVILSELFVSFSQADTYSVLVFLSAGVTNFMVPSGGGQWAIQAPVVLDGAHQLGVSTSEVVMAVAWGDAWTNLAQPFWALPLLAIVGLGIKDIYSYCLGALLVSGVVISGLLVVF